MFGCQLNVGCDEPWEFASGCSRTLAQEIGPAPLYYNWLHSLSVLSSRHERHMQFWADGILKFFDLINQVPVNSTPIIWGYEAEHPFVKECQVLEKASLPFLVAPGNSTWNSFSGRYHTAKVNVKNAAIAGMQHGAQGMIMTHWGDNGHAQTWPVQLPGIVLAAAHAWNVKRDVDVPKALDVFVLQDASGRAGQAILNLASMDDCLPFSLHNRSILFDLFVANEQVNIPGLERIKPAHFDACLAVLHSVDEDMRQATVRCPNAQWLCDEMQLASDMLRWAIHNAQAGFRGRRNLQMKKTLGEIIRRYQGLWVRRNRPGGCGESVDGVFQLFERLLGIVCMIFPVKV